MKKGWNKYKFKELVHFQPSVKLQKGEEYWFIPMEDIEEKNSYVFPKQKKVFDGSSGAKFSDGDIIFSRITPCLQNGKITQAILGQGQSGFGSTEYFVFRGKKRIVDQKFLFYFVTSNAFTGSAINSMVGASGRQRADKGYINNLDLLLPPIDEQEKVGTILSLYDDLILNNSKRISILEKMAQQIFREWFVRMRFPGYENTRFVKGIPVDWKIQSIGETVNVLMGQSPKSEFYNEDGVGLPFHQGVGSYGNIYPNHDVFCSVNGRIANEGDILFSVRAPVGRLNLADRKLIIGRGLSAMNHKKGFNSFLFHFLKYQFSREDIIGNGAIFNSVGKDELKGFKYYAPTDKLIQDFEEKVIPIDGAIKNLYHQIKLLQSTRDKLLPRLISGQLSVEHLTKKLQETA
ncbi:MAG: restriction endonuclease subunit S [Crocinitomicaceae bacterium]|nr:restriction endonuclease subunit S [Crocinitomicaceae bacterium]